MFRAIHHVALAVRSLDQAVQCYQEVLGLPLGRCEPVQDQGVRAALFPLARGEIELLEPVDPAGGLARFLAKRGEALHHICIATTDIDADLAAVKAAGLPLIDQAPRRGLAGRIAFLHPHASRGILVELAQPPEGSQHPAAGAGIEAVALETVYVGVDDPADAAETLARNFAGRTRGMIEDRRLGLPTVAVQLGSTQVAFLDAGDALSARFRGRPHGLLGLRLSVRDLEAARRHLASTATAAEVLDGGPEPPLVRLDPARTSGMNLFLAQA